MLALLAITSLSCPVAVHPARILADSIMSHGFDDETGFDYRAAYVAHEFQVTARPAEGEPAPSRVWTFRFSNDRVLEIRYSEVGKRWTFVRFPASAAPEPEFGSYSVPSNLSVFVTKMNASGLFAAVGASTYGEYNTYGRSASVSITKGLQWHGLPSTDEIRLTVDGAREHLVALEWNGKCADLDWSETNMSLRSRNEALAALSEITFRKWPAGLEYNVIGPYYGEPRGEYPIDPDFPVKPDWMLVRTPTETEIRERYERQFAFLSDKKAHPYYVVTAKKRAKGDPREWVGSLWVRADSLKATCYVDKFVLQELGMPSP